jgi:hypothetical protein
MQIEIAPSCCVAVLVDNLLINTAQHCGVGVGVVAHGGVAVQPAKSKENNRERMMNVGMRKKRCLMRI